jgi:hypothetical protein
MEFTRGLGKSSDHRLYKGELRNVVGAGERNVLRLPKRSAIIVDGIIQYR